MAGAGLYTTTGLPTHLRYTTLCYFVLRTLLKIDISKTAVRVLDDSARVENPTSGMAVLDCDDDGVQRGRRDGPGE